MSVEMSDRLRKMAGVSTARMRGDLTLIVAPRFMAMDRSSAASSLLDGARQVPLELTDELTPMMVPSSGVVVVQVDI